MAAAWRWIALPPFLALGLCGCVAVDVGRPETFQVEVPAGEETRTVGREVLFGQVVAETGGGSGDATFPVEFSLCGLVDRAEQKGRKSNVVDVTRRKRLSFGLFPGTAEWIYRPEGAAIAWGDMTPSGQTEALQRFRYDFEFGGSAPMPFRAMPAGGLALPWALKGACGIVYGAPLVPWFLLAEPFAGNWTCQSHLCWIDRGICWQAKGDRDFRKTDRWRTDMREQWIHWMPLGFFRHSFLAFSEEREGPWTPTGPVRHLREKAVAKGPFRVELSIPGLGFAESRTARPGTEKVGFDVPRGERPGEVVALVKFRAEGAVTDESERALLEDASKWTQAVPLWLPGPPGAELKVVVEDSTVREAPLRYSKERDSGDGETSWLVEILDDSLDTLDVAAFARPLILAELRTGWLERHPAEDAGCVGASVKWGSGENVNTLVFTGTAFSVRPVAEGWRYDAESRRGEVLLRVSGGSDAEAVRRWSRENVESIVRDREVLLEGGEPPPAGGRYRSLSERLEDGMLTVEFEVVQ